MRIHHFHKDYNAPWLPNPPILHTHCFQFLLGITDLTREIDGYAKYRPRLTRYIIVYVKMVNYAKDVCTSSLQCRETQFMIKIMSNLKIDDL